MSAVQQDLFDGLSPSPFPQGFRYFEDAITPEQESSLLSQIAGLPFKEFQFHGFEGKRRVVSFGWRYDYSQNRALPADPIPDFLINAYHQIQSTAGFRLPGLQQALVTEYAPGAPIGWHKDRSVFGAVMGLSLISPCTMRLRNRVGDKWQRSSIVLQPRSAYFFEGPVRWEWEHSIPPVPELRYSITFRNLRGTS
jgi:alkylated DNA repair dioxygenase AlkB